MTATTPVHPTFRHPRPIGHEGRCIGQTDVAVNPRKVRRLARRIRRMAQRGGWPRVVCTSPLRRCCEVGRVLRRRWGWSHVVDAALMEAHFGAWEGRAWSSIPRAEVDAWVLDFADHAPGGGESLRQVLGRAAGWQAPEPGAVIVAHAGWMLARRWVQAHGAGIVPHSAIQWPAAPAYAACWHLP